MTVPAIVALIYAVLLMVGGIIGFIKSHSLISFFTGAVSALFMGLSGFYILKEDLVGFRLGIATSFVLFALFTYRYWETQKVMPAAVFSIVSLIVFSILFFYRRPWE